MKTKHLLFAIFYFISSVIFAQTTTFYPTEIPLSSDEIINPGRGFYRWNSEEEAPYPSIDRYKRYKWSDIESSQGVYNFSVLDAEAAAAASDPDGKGKFSFGVRCVVGGTNRSYPAYLDGLMTSWYSNAKLCWVPDWNDNDFLLRLEALIDTLGARYNNDPRIGFVEIRSYGNWGEWHLSGFETPPAPLTSINIGCIQRMIDTHVNSFPDKQIIMMSDNNDGLSYAMSKTGLKYPIGWRRDSWCYDPTFSLLKTKSAWISGGASTRWQTAPVIVEGYGGSRMNYAYAVPHVIDYHISAIGNGNINDWDTMRQSARDSIVQSVKTSGYRYVIRSVTHPVAVSTNKKFALSVVWSNIGVAPIYEKRDVKYRIINPTNGVIVWEYKSILSLRNLLPTYNFSNQTDTPVTFTDSLIIPSTIAKGNYNIDVIISDSTGYSDPLRMAITDRKADGAYPLGTITIASVPNAPTNIVAVAGNTQATISFTYPNDGGTPITGYTVYKYVNAIRIKPGIFTSVSPVVFAGLTNGTAYTFRVVATNAIGDGNYSSASNAVIPHAPLSAPDITTSFKEEKSSEPFLSTIDGNMRINNCPQNSTITVYNLVGSVIVNRLVNQNNTIDVPLMKCGVYCININTKGKDYSIKYLCLK